MKRSSTYKQLRITDDDIVRVEGDPPVAYLVRMPEGSVYEGLNFWHPAKCTFKIKRGGYRLSFRPDVWRFKLYPNTKEDVERYECRVIIDADEMLSCWANKTT
jgi:hypothetical protein